MAKLKADPITEADLRDFVANDSDFAFEMQVLSCLRKHNFDCAHAGTYQDPVSDKIRQFDIRAYKERGQHMIALAVECKNLRPNHPLLVSAMPRSGAEAFHDIMVHEPGMFVLVKIRPAVGDGSPYKVGEMVGKKTDQVGREEGSGGLTRDDSATFEKLNQAMNSCNDLVRHCVFEQRAPLFCVIVPVLIVPEGLLWQVDYEDDGSMRTPPRRVTRSTLFVNHSWSVDRGPNYGITNYKLSHLEIVSLDALPGIANSWLDRTGFFLNC